MLMTISGMVESSIVCSLGVHVNAAKCAIPWGLLCKLRNPSHVDANNTNANIKEHNLRVSESKRGNNENIFSFVAFNVYNTPVSFLVMRRKDGNKVDDLTT
eukprot:527017_1